MEQILPMSQKHSNKVLFAGGGRRVALSKRFLSSGFSVEGYELDPRCPLANVGTVHKGYAWGDPRFRVDFLNLLEVGNFDLVIPLQDAAVAMLSSFVLPNLVCSEEEAAETCLDKGKFEDFMLQNFPHIYPKIVRSSFPVIAKPIRGFASQDLHKVYNYDDLQHFSKNPNYVIQNFVFGTEYSVDSYFSPLGVWYGSVPRIRSRVSGGEVISSETVSFPELVHLTKRVSTLMGLTGPTNTQFIVSQDGEIFMTEINARFGGGCTLSMEAGLDVLSYLKMDYLDGPEVDPILGGYKVGLKLERSHRDHFFN